MAVNAQQERRTSERTEDRPVAAFVVSLIAAVSILAGSGAVMMTSFPVNRPYNPGGMMSGYYGGMMGGYYGMMNGLGVAGSWI